MYRNPYLYQIKYILIFSIISKLAFSQEQKQLIDDVNINIGLTCFKNPFKDDKFRNNMATIAKAGYLGLEFYNKKTNLSIEAQKTYWLSLTASDFLHDVNGWASYSRLGFTKFFKINKEHELGLNLSHMWVAENSTMESYQQESIILRKAFYDYHTARAISIAPSINLTQKLYVEARVNIYYFTRHDSIATGVNANRIQLSLIYKINPLKK